MEVVKYSEADRAAVRDICFRTGFLGATLEGIVNNKDLFIDLSTHYFLDVMESGVFIAREDGRVAGYLFVADEKAFGRFSRKYYIRRVAADVLRLRIFNKKDFKFYVGIFRSYFRHEFDFGTFPEYPAVLHVNILKEYQGSGVGEMLFGEMFEHLRALGRPGVRLQTTTANPHSVHFFKKHGFEELASKETKFYIPYGYAGVRNVVMGLKQY